MYLLYLGEIVSTMEKKEGRVTEGSKKIGDKHARNERRSDPREEVKIVSSIGNSYDTAHFPDMNPS